MLQGSGRSEDVPESEDASVAASVMSVHRHHLEDKLQELQQKRYEMEDLMKELKELRREQKHHLNQLQMNNGRKSYRYFKKKNLIFSNAKVSIFFIPEMKYVTSPLCEIGTFLKYPNVVDVHLVTHFTELDGGSTTSSQAHMLDGIIASTTAQHTAKDAGEVLQLLETRKKLKKLQDVRERLNQLRDLVQYYQSGTEFIHGDGDEQSSLPAYENYYETTASNLR